MFIHKSIKFTTLNIDNYCLDQDFEVRTIHLNSFCYKLRILAIYRSPLGNFTTFLSNFDLILNKFFNLKFNFIICGDININYPVESFKKINLTIFYTLLITVASLIFLLERTKFFFNYGQCFYR
jgi:hypothetical protein